MKRIAVISFTLAALAAGAQERPSCKPDPVTGQCPVWTCRPGEFCTKELCVCVPTAPAVMCEIRVMYPVNRPDLAFVGIPVNAQCDRAAAEIATSAWLAKLIAGTVTLPR